MFREFPKLKVKDNLNIRAKKVRKAAYIASIYAMKLSKGIHRISRQGKNIKVEDIEKVLRINPMHVVKNIIKTKLVTYRNGVNDMDTFTGLKFTYKGPSGIADGSSSAVPDSARFLEPSHIGITDQDSSSNSDPGLGGMLAPYVSTNTQGYLDDKHVEPNEWENDFKQLMNEYKNIKGLEEVIQFKRTLTGDYDKEYHELIHDSMKAFAQLTRPVHEVDIQESFILEQPFSIIREETD